MAPGGADVPAAKRRRMAASKVIYIPKTREDEWDVVWAIACDSMFAEDRKVTLDKTPNYADETVGCKFLGDPDHVWAAEVLLESFVHNEHSVSASVPIPATLNETAKPVVEELSNEMASKGIVIQFIDGDTESGVTLSGPLPFLAECAAAISHKLRAVGVTQVDTSEMKYELPMQKPEAQALSRFQTGLVFVMQRAQQLGKSKVKLTKVNEPDSVSGLASAISDTCRIKASGPLPYIFNCALYMSTELRKTSNTEAPSAPSPEFFGRGDPDFPPKHRLCSATLKKETCKATGCKFVHGVSDFSCGDDGVKLGDWVCLTCGLANPTTPIEPCKLCQSMRPHAAPLVCPESKYMMCLSRVRQGRCDGYGCKAAHNGLEIQGRGKIRYPKDWVCPTCGSVNGSKLNQCRFKPCEKPKPRHGLVTMNQLVLFKGERGCIPCLRAKDPTKCQHGFGCIKAHTLDDMTQGFGGDWLCDACGWPNVPQLYPTACMDCYARRPIAPVILKQVMCVDIMKHGKCEAKDRPMDARRTCHFFFGGRCTYGEDCPRAHTLPPCRAAHAAGDLVTPESKAGDWCCLSCGVVNPVTALSCIRVTCQARKHGECMALPPPGAPSLCYAQQELVPAEQLAAVRGVVTAKLQKRNDIRVDEIPQEEGKVLFLVRAQSRIAADAAADALRRVLPGYAPPKIAGAADGPSPDKLICALYLRAACRGGCGFKHAESTEPDTSVNEKWAKAYLARATEELLDMIDLGPTGN